MIVAISTSSPWTSVALIDENGVLVAEASEHSPMQASAACFRLLSGLLEQNRVELSSITGIASDLGPGSFTGVKVGVTIAKTMAYTLGVPTYGLDAFDLIDSTRTAAIPSRKGEYFIRELGKEVSRTSEPPKTALGYGPDFSEPRFPSAARFAGRDLVPVEPERLVPNYILEPSISLPKKPLSPLDQPHA